MTSQVNTVIDGGGQAGLAVIANVPAQIEQPTISKVVRRLVPFLMFCYFIAYLDRVNVGFAGPTMKGSRVSPDRVRRQRRDLPCYFFLEVVSLGLLCKPCSAARCRATRSSLEL